MNINGIDSTLIPNISVYGAQTKSSSDNHDNNSVQEQTKSDNPAVIAEISEEGKRLEAKMYKAGESPGNLEASYLKNREQQRADLIKAREERVQNEIDPFDDPFQMMCVSAVYPPGTLGEYVQKNLEGKAINPSLVANEMVLNIGGSVYNPNATVEERAINRETALRHIEYIAQNYFSDPDEAKAFIDGVNGFAEKDIMREKGYIVADNSDRAPYRSYALASDQSNIYSNEYAKKYGASMDELKEFPEKLAAFNIALGKYQNKWREEIVKDFGDNEKRVADIIAKVKGSLSETAVNDSLQRILKAFAKTDN